MPPLGPRDEGVFLVLQKGFTFGWTSHWIEHQEWKFNLTIIVWLVGGLILCRNALEAWKNKGRMIKSSPSLSSSSSSKTTRVKIPSSAASYSCKDLTLRIMYLCLTGLCVFMAFWILIFPSSWLTGHSDAHDRFVRERLFEDPLSQVWDAEAGKMIVVPTPPSLLQKYDGQWAVQFTHVLPAALWSSLAPLQIHPAIRQRHRTFHRRAGYAFAISALLVAVGVVLIHQRDLYYHRVDFPHLRQGPDDEHKHERGISHYGLGHHVPVFLAVTAWFVGSLLTALWYAVAVSRGKDVVTLHRAFMLRHIAAGIWVAVQRIYVALMSAETLVDQKAVFGDGAFVGLAITLSVAELAIWLLKKEASTKIKFHAL